MKIKPMLNRVLVVRIESPSMTKSGIHIPGKAKEAAPAQRGKVLAVGDGRWKDGIFYAPALKEGDVVLFSKFAGVEIDDGEGGQGYVMLEHDDVLAVVG